jgi:carboxyl-terminal processing protease
MMEKRNNLKIWLPLVASAFLVLGMLLGSFLSRNSLQKSGMYVNKLNALMSLIETRYVDSVSQSQLIEDLMPDILAQLDPHSVYLSAKDVQAANEPIEGSFSGIGVQFNIVDDTARVVSVVAGGPSQKVGILPGDKIVRIDGKSFIGKQVTNDGVLKRLRGQKGTPVKVTVLRERKHQLITYSILRDDIPIYSVEARYRIGEDIGYIKISTFGRNAHSEFIQAMGYLRQNKCSKFIIDLRGNTGGLMEPALEIANEFLPEGRMILYTQGKSYPKEEYRSNGKGLFQGNPLVILTDEWSASSSEILTGAMQDNDRAYIVGRRTFGKGLVQNEIPFRDGSAVRLTIARFYIPSGRCIQKPYHKGMDVNYQNDILNRYMGGEFDSEDSIDIDLKQKYKTFGGRIVYGGGGILPDYFVPLDTSGVTSWYNKVSSKGLIQTFAFLYTDAHRDSLKLFRTPNKLSAYLDEQNLIPLFVDYAWKRGVMGRDFIIQASYPLILTQIKAFIARNILNEDAFWKILQEDDQTLTKGVAVVATMKGNTVHKPLRIHQK